MIKLIKHYDTLVNVMASETFVPGGMSQCLNPQDSHRAAKHCVELLATQAGRRNDQIIIDPGLAPVGGDTYGLSNFAWGTPKGVREELEKAYLTLGVEVGLDFALMNPEKTPMPLPKDHPIVARFRNALEQGQPRDGETHETSGLRQAEAIAAICKEPQPADS